MTQVFQKAAAFAGSQDELARMAREAIAEYKAGKTKPLNLSRGI
jgi:hypothetical protein